MVRGAKRYAAARGTSVSRLVERYLDLPSKPPKSDHQTPVFVCSAVQLAGFRRRTRRHLSRRTVKRSCWI